MRRVDHLVVGPQPFFEETQQIGLPTGVKAQTRLIQQQNVLGVVVTTQRREPDQKREEPDEAGASLVEAKRQEWRDYIMQVTDWELKNYLPKY